MGQGADNGLPSLSRSEIRRGVPQQTISQTRTRCPALLANRPVTPMYSASSADSTRATGASGDTGDTAEGKGGGTLFGSGCCPSLPWLLPLRPPLSGAPWPLACTTTTATRRRRRVAGALRNDSEEKPARQGVPASLDDSARSDAARDADVPTELAMGPTPTMSVVSTFKDSVIG